MPNKLKLGFIPQENQLAMLYTQGGPREGAGRKGIGGTRKVSLTLTEDDWAAFEAICQDRPCSKSELLREIIHGYLHLAANTNHNERE
ncbi:hypothetical protein [Paenibacillus sacheonensis]|uniref:Ribbon-helix-helix protein CopG domain-containing protein n=1 Tax=Paenibacillus sacheonensis TaxID=742054 RepID=A0A7X4YQG9_9BACL|nr:hypothetical protein [Paenibacillus sacheonensis]MBM7566691.1 hypothetical protein [Paenibacillus sacheonensis]NBC70670.1 hypothetical protein [Paenibacillus sacheonensis]